MQNYRLEIEYDGTRYYGWEHQPNVDTIQGKLENVLAEMCSIKAENIELNGAGRTDAGVHAKDMTANVKLNTDKTTLEIRDYLNRYLPEDIAVTSVERAGERFHARYNASGKTYRYSIYDGKVKPVFDRRYYTPLENELDIDAMRSAAGYLIGEHDFKSFCGNPKMKKSTVRKIDKIDILRSGGYVYISIHGSGFLQNMVRIISGTLIEIGLHKRPADEMKTILEARDRQKAGYTAPAKGLCLIKTDYD